MLAAFFDGVVGEADHVEVLHARGANVDLDFDEVGVDSIDGGADGFEKHFLARREDEIRYRRRTEEGSRRGRTAKHKPVRQYTLEILD
jgi:hypothetical protein